MQPTPTPLTNAVAARPGRIPVAWDWLDVTGFIALGFAGAIIGAWAGAILSLPIAQFVILGTHIPPDVGLALQTLLIETGTYCGIIAALMGMVHNRHHTTFRDLGWRPTTWRWLAITPLACAAAFAVATTLATLSGHFFPDAPSTQCLNVQKSYGHLLWLAIPAVSLVAPLAEETVFRGFLYGWLRKNLTLIPSVAVSATLFAAAHLQLSLFIPLIGVGAILAVIYEKSGSLVPGAVVHGLFNLIGIIAILNATSCA